MANSNKAMFVPKDKATRFQGIMTAHGRKRFEEQRRKLTRMFRDVMGYDNGGASDGDVVEYLARGEADTRHYLKSRAAKEG